MKENDRQNNADDSNKQWWKVMESKFPVHDQAVLIAGSATIMANPKFTTDDTMKVVAKPVVLKAHPTPLELQPTFLMLHPTGMVPHLIVMEPDPAAMTHKTIAMVRHSMWMVTDCMPVVSEGRPMMAGWIWMVGSSGLCLSGNRRVTLY